MKDYLAVWRWRAGIEVGMKERVGAGRDGMLGIEMLDEEGCGLYVVCVVVRLYEEPFGHDERAMPTCLMPFCVCDKG